MQQHRDVKLAGDFSDLLNVWRIAIHRKLLLSDSNSTSLEVLFDYRLSFRQVGKLVCKKEKFLRVTPGKVHHSVVGAAVRGKSVLRTGRKQDSFLNTKRALVRH